MISRIPFLRLSSSFVGEIARGEERSRSIEFLFSFSDRNRSSVDFSSRRLFSKIDPAQNPSVGLDRTASAGAP